MKPNFLLSTPFALFVLVIMVVVFQSCDFQFKTSSAFAKRPLNFVIIFVDDMGYGDLSSYGHPTIDTPHLDRMAQEGQKWTQFYVAASVCTPSRAALLTGRLPLRSGMAGGSNRVLFPNSAHGLAASEITLAEQLKAQGYATGMVGKWHLGHKKEFLPTNHGFDHYYGIPYSNDMNRDSDVLPDVGYWEMWTDTYKELTPQGFDIPILLGTELVEQPANQYTLTQRYTQEAMDWIRAHKEQPFFLYLAHNLPHVPLFVSEAFEGRSERGLYGDVIEEIDHGVGNLLQVLREENLAENTIVLFTSDNGPWLPTGISGGSAGLLQNGKGSTWEGGFRVPCIFWGPKTIQPKVVSDLGTTLDIFTTFSKLAGATVHNDRYYDGVDLSSVLLDGNESPRNEVFYYFKRELYAVRVGAFKAHFVTEDVYVPTPNKTYHDPPLLFNLNEDPSERFNIADQYPEVIKHIQEITAKHKKNMHPGPDLLKKRGQSHEVAY
ncbi:MAG: sulfatase family protein [Flavobacteriaceae bacterium]